MSSTDTMTTIDSVVLDVPDPAAAEAFYPAAFGLGPEVVGLRAADAMAPGFRGYTLSLVVAQPADVDQLVASALEAGASPIKPAKKSLWGYGAVVRSPDGAIWKVATSSKKNKGPATREIDEIVLLLGVADMAESKQFYVEHGLPLARSFGRRYAEFSAPAGRIKLALYGRAALAKDAGVPVEGDGPHHIAIRSAATFTDPDGFAWETA